MTGISRRRFLKGSGATAGALAIASIQPMPVFASEPKIGRTDGKVLTAGRMGILLAEVKDGKLVNTTNALPSDCRKPFTTNGSITSSYKSSY